MQYQQIVCSTSRLLCAVQQIAVCCTSRLLCAVQQIAVCCTSRLLCAVPADRCVLYQQTAVCSTSRSLCAVPADCCVLYQQIAVCCTAKLRRPRKSSSLRHTKFQYRAHNSHSVTRYDSQPDQSTQHRHNIFIYNPLQYYLPVHVHISQGVPCSVFRVQFSTFI